MATLKEGTNYYLNKNYATDECCWILETIQDSEESETHLYLDAMWGVRQWIKKEQVVELTLDIYYTVNYLIKEYYLGMYSTEDELGELNGEIASYLKDNGINY